MKPGLTTISLFLALAHVSPAAVIGQLGVLQSTANGGINPATGVAWAPGDTYRLVFVTSTTTAATSGDIATYNAFVNNVADNSSAYPNLGGVSWFVVGSTAAVDARDNTGTNPTVSTGVPVLLLNGTTSFATNNTDLWNGSAFISTGVFQGINFDENGSATAFTEAWTGTLGLGGTEVQPAGPNIGSLGALDGTTTYGAINPGANSQWGNIFQTTNSGLRPVYAMSEVLTVVPEPSTALLGGLGLLALLRRRR